MTTFYFDEAALAKKDDALVAAFCSIPAEYSVLSLKKAGLYTVGAYYLSRAFASLPPTIDEVDLSLNSLHMKTASELKQSLDGLPQTVTKINLSSNSLSTFLKTDLVEIISAMQYIEEVTLIEKTLNAAQNKELADFLQHATGKKIITTPLNPSFFATPAAPKAAPIEAHDATKSDSASPKQQ
jgi:hypothetical protein